MQNDPIKKTRYKKHLISYNTSVKYINIFDELLISAAHCCLLFRHPVKKEKKIYKEIQKGSGAKLYMKKGFLIYEEICKYLVTFEEAVSHI